MAVRSKAWVYGPSHAGIVGSNLAGVHGCLSVLSVVTCQLEVSKRRADHSSRGVLPTVVRRCVWSRNLKNEEATTHWELSRLGEERRIRWCSWTAISGASPTFLKATITSSCLSVCPHGASRLQLEELSRNLILQYLSKIYLFININQLDALNFIISLFQASTCFQHMCSSSGGQNRIIQSLVSSYYPIGGSPVHGTATYMCDGTRGCIIQFLPSWRWAHVLETCRGLK